MPTSQPPSNPPVLARAARLAGPLRSLRGWTRVVDAVCPMAGGDRYAFDVPFFGLRYRGTLGSFIDRQVYFSGAYEKDELAFVRQWWGQRAGSRGGGIAIDVGANVGHHTLAFSRIFGAVHAFEPNPGPLVRLRQSLADNQISNVTVYPLGLWDRDAELPFNTPPASNTGMGSFKDDVDSLGATGPQTLPVRAGDPLLQAAGIERIDCLKIDVQGAEHEVLVGLKQTLARSRPLIWIEISPSTRKDLPTLAALTAVVGGGRFQALTFTRSQPWLNGVSATLVDDAAYTNLDGNLLLVPHPENTSSS